MDKVYRRQGFVCDNASVDDAFTVTVDGEGTNVLYHLELPREISSYYDMSRPIEGTHALRVLVSELSEALRQLEIREAQALAITKEVVNL